MMSRAIACVRLRNIITVGACETGGTKKTRPMFKANGSYNPATAPPAKIAAVRPMPDPQDWNAMETFFYLPPHASAQVQYAYEPCGLKARMLHLVLLLLFGRSTMLLSVALKLANAAPPPIR